jgi:diacylglycerol kinase
MYLTIFCVLLTLSLALVALGLFRTEHTELCLIGFVFIFLLSMTLLNGGIENKVGTTTSSNFSYTANASGTNLTLLTSSVESVIDVYSPVKYDGIIQHVLGYFLAFGSLAGFVLILFSMKKERL